MLEDLFAAADNHWFTLPQAEIVNAIAQQGPSAFSDEPLSKKYQERFGFQLLIDPAQKLPVLHRIKNSPAEELRTASEIVLRLIEAGLTHLLEQCDLAEGENQNV